MRSVSFYFFKEFVVPSYNSSTLTCSNIFNRVKTLSNNICVFCSISLSILIISTKSVTIFFAPFFLNFFISYSTKFGSIVKVSASISVKTGFDLLSKILLIVETKVMGVVITLVFLSQLSAFPAK